MATSVHRSQETKARVLIRIHLNQAQGSNILKYSKTGSCATNATMTGRQEASKSFAKQEHVKHCTRRSINTFPQQPGIYCTHVVSNGA